MDKIQHALEDILSRELSNGGFGYADKEPFSPEASAWAVLALRSSGTHRDAAERACNQLARFQQAEGSVRAVEGHSDAVWCTPLCILAWKSLPGYDKPVKTGINFLLSMQGRHKTKRPDSPGGHDPSIVGWPWIKQTHSWIEPTSLAMLALKSNGQADHPRTREAARMLMDRQLPTGGWNYGNTTVFDKELLPTPVNTGQALAALGGMVAEAAVNRSLQYLVDSVNKVRTPMSLAWMLQGLNRWSMLPPEWKSFVSDSLDLQNRYGPYNTVLLAQLVTVYFTEAKLDQIVV